MRGQIMLVRADLSPQEYVFYTPSRRTYLNKLFTMKLTKSSYAILILLTERLYLMQFSQEHLYNNSKFLSWNAYNKTEPDKRHSQSREAFAIQIKKNKAETSHLYKSTVDNNNPPSLRKIMGKIKKEVQYFRRTSSLSLSSSLTGRVCAYKRANVSSSEADTKHFVIMLSYLSGVTMWDGFLRQNGHKQCSKWPNKSWRADLWPFPAEPKWTLEPTLFFFVSELLWKYRRGT